MKIFKGNLIHTPDKESFSCISHGYLVEENEKVVYCGETLPEKYRGIPIHDYKDCILIPGFVDAHVHPCQLPNIGLGYDLELLPWLEKYTYRQEQRLSDIEYAQKVYQAYVHENWSYGITHCIAMATTNAESTLLLMKLLEEAHLGGFVGKVNQDCNCGKPEFMETTEQSIQETERWLTSALNFNGSVKPILTPTINIICSAELMKYVGEKAEAYQLPVQAHLSENIHEVEFCRELYPDARDFSDVYDQYGLFGQQKTMMAHCIHLSDRELELMKSRKILAAHCPNSNINLSSGLMNAKKYLDMGITVGLGSDIAGGNTLNPFENIKAALQTSQTLWIQGKQEQKLKPSEAFYMATAGGGSFFGKVGCFLEGYDCNILVLDDGEKTMFNQDTLEERILRLIYSGTKENIREMYIKGEKIEEPFRH